jgi:hypothetical protein
MSVLTWMVSGLNADPVLRLEVDPVKPGVPFLSWDTEGGPRAKRNLLRADSAVTLRLLVDGKWQNADLPFTTERTTNGARYRTLIGGEGVIVELLGTASRMEMTFATDSPAEISAELLFPFDPRVTPTTVIPADWTAEGRFTFPAVLNAPDFGPMLLSVAENASGSASQPARPPVKGRLEGSRAEKRVDLTLELGFARDPLRLTLSPLLLHPPDSLKDTQMWIAARRGWLNAVQPCARWGEQNRPFSAPAGMLGNNVVSDPASCSLWFYADQVLWVSRIAPGVSAANSLRRTIDWWLDEKTRPDGEVICYWHYGGFLDANAGPIIAAWDYVECTGDKKWLRGKIERIEFVADFLIRRDVDGDGLIEAVQSGNLGTLVQPKRSCAWWDALNCGHKDGYTNAVIYRAFRCLADMEGRLGRADEAERFAEAADRLKVSYARTLLNPDTGWLAWWKSADGELHDYASPTLNGIAIEYGLVGPEQGRQILAKLWAKIDAVGFKRFDLGVPPMLIPVRRGDYLLPQAIGLPQREDGTDTFGQYMNGGITAGHVLHFLAAHYVVGWNEPADRVLRAMLERQQRGEFQNGVTDASMQGIDWTTWDGRPSGYEGYLADSFRFLQAVLIREPALRDRLYRPLN